MSSTLPFADFSTPMTLRSSTWRRSVCEMNELRIKRLLGSNGRMPKLRVPVLNRIVVRYPEVGNCGVRARRERANSVPSTERLQPTTHVHLRMAAVLLHSCHISRESMASIKQPFLPTPLCCAVMARF